MVVPVGGGEEGGRRGRARGALARPYRGGSVGDECHHAGRKRGGGAVGGGGRGRSSRVQGRRGHEKEEDVRPNFWTLAAPFNNCTVLTTMTTLHVVFRRRTSKSASRDHQSSIASGSVEFFR